MQSTLDRWRKALAIGAGLLCLSTPALAQGARDLQNLARGVQSVREKAYSRAVPLLKGLPERLPALADYAAFSLGQAYYELGDNSAAMAALEITCQYPLPSPLTGHAVVLSAEALSKTGKASQAVALLRQYYSRIPVPAAEAGLAKAFEAAGDAVSAAASWQRVYYSFSNSEQAREASDALRRLRLKLGAAFPTPLGQSILARAKALADAKRFLEARRELESAVLTLGGAERDLARVRIGSVDYLARQNLRAHQYLNALKVDDPEADAERLYHLLALAKRLDREEQMARFLRELDQKHPQSNWRLEGILTVANHYLMKNERDRWEPLYRTCAALFSSSPEASFCDWKITWANYLRRQPDTEKILKNHLKQYPGSEKAPATLYFLGRMAESGRDPGSAMAYYTTIDQHYPNHYYAMLARDRMATVSKAMPNQATLDLLKAIPFPQHRQELSFEPTDATRRRLERAKLLESAGLDEPAESELRFAARTDGQSHIIAIDLARVLRKRGAEDEALRAVKAYVPNYLSVPMESAPSSFWRVAFPLPYRESLERNARQKSLDPYVLAGLIRQESEFNPRAVSRTSARGLTQVMPSTGRQLSRQTGMNRYSTQMLFEPEVNLKLGAHYLHQLLASLGGKWEETLASYNGGKSRVMRWLGWGEFREPAEFIETIPIKETRDYVQIVLRNASVYRKLYANASAAIPSENGSARGEAPRLASQRQ
ncbi:MAG: transglycosylase SLT domain-containing protein [Acidobacteria bacterium]|nr:transglycosylase SLT domain-containing protein [Acidobacteriota bacterium]